MSKGKLWTAMRPKTRILYSSLRPHSGPRRAKRAEELQETSQGLCRDIKGRAFGWFLTLATLVVGALWTVPALTQSGGTTTGAGGVASAGSGSATDGGAAV